MWKILVVDDHFANRQLITEILKDMADCDIASNGKEAIDAFNLSLRGHHYDAILLDIAMPEINGLEFLRLLRDTEQEAGVLSGQGTPVIMITAHKECFVNAFEIGCDDYILKPIDPNMLIMKIKERLGDPS